MVLPVSLQCFVPGRDTTGWVVMGTSAQSVRFLLVFIMQPLDGNIPGVNSKPETSRWAAAYPVCCLRPTKKKKKTQKVWRICGHTQKFRPCKVNANIISVFRLCPGWEFKIVSFLHRIFLGPSHPKELCQLIPSQPDPEPGRGTALLSHCLLHTPGPQDDSSLLQR